MNEFEIYYVAFHKHDAPQALMAGPFIDWDKAQEEAELLKSTKRGHFVVVAQAITIKEPFV